MTELELLQEIAKGNVSWRNRSFRYWTTDDAYTLVTKDIKHLDAAHYRKEMAAGYTYVTRGPVELTRLGSARLRELESQ